MQVNEVYEKIKVGVVFENQKIVPKWFFWGRRKHTVTAIEHSWRSKEGESPLVFFSVSDGSNVYEIKFNLKSAEWTLEKVYMEG